MEFHVRWPQQPGSCPGLCHGGAEQRCFTARLIPFLQASFAGPWGAELLPPGWAAARHGVGFSFTPTDVPAVFCPAFQSATLCPLFILQGLLRLMVGN